MEIDFKYTPMQQQVFFDCDKRRRIVTKGRRLGMTQGTSQAFIEWALERKRTMMWGDTVNINIERYVTRYFMPILKQLPKDVYQWRKQDKQMEFSNGSVIDFRSADNPENWEGFGYDIIFLNEAGIILKNRYLYENAVRPMLLDFPDSILIAGGTPKGKNLFYELYLNGLDESMEDWVSFKFSTYDNPFLTRKDIDEMVKELPESAVKQEIYGDFVDTTENQFIEGEAVMASMDRVLNDREYDYEPMILGVDVARFGDDCSVLMRRQGKQAFTPKIFRDLDTMAVADLVVREIREFKCDAVFIDVGSMGAGVVDRVRQLGYPVTEISFGSKAIADKRYYNKRSEMWGEMREWITRGGALPIHTQLKKELTEPSYNFDNKERIVLEKKEDMKKRGVGSPDIADALALTFAMPVAKEIDRFLTQDYYQEEYDPMNYEF